jgi:hypothetical protein
MRLLDIVRENPGAVAGLLSSVTALIWAIVRLLREREINRRLALRRKPRRTPRSGRPAV